MGYQLDHKDREERERIRVLEAAGDPVTLERLRAIDVRPGWNCLEVGAGAGSIARWLCGRVGPGGNVVATDLETKFLEQIDEPNLEVRRHDLRTDPLEDSTFDLVHARALLEHLPERDELINKLVLALKPGGWLLVESGDYLSFVSVEGDPENLLESTYPKFFDVLVSAGFDPHYGRRLGTVFRANGLEKVKFEGRLWEWGGERPITAIWLLMFQRFRDKSIENGLVSSSQADEFLELVENSSFSALTPIVVSAWGRRPIQQ
jgi:SAM-dependent methyltransferase